MDARTGAKRGSDASYFVKLARLFLFLLRIQCFSAAEILLSNLAAEAVAVAEVVLVALSTTRSCTRLSV